MRRWSGDSGLFFDACPGCSVCSQYTQFLFKTFLPWVGQWEALQRQGRREARGELDEVSDYPRSYGTGKNYWMPFGSLLFMELHLWNTSLPLFLFFFPSLPLCNSPILPPSSLIGDAIKVCGVSGSSRSDGVPLSAPLLVTQMQQTE